MKNLAKCNPACATQYLYEDVSGWTITTNPFKGKTFLEVRNEGIRKQVYERPIKYDNGTIAYDNPERLPKYIKAIVSELYSKTFVQLRIGEEKSKNGIELSYEAIYEFKEDENGNNFRLIINGVEYPECRTAFNFVQLN